MLGNYWSIFQTVGGVGIFAAANYVWALCRHGSRHAAVRTVSIAAKLNCFRAGQLDVFGNRLVQYCIFQYLLLYGDGMDDVVYGSYFAVHGAKYSHDFICHFI